MMSQETLYKSALDSISGAILLWGPDGRLAFASQAFLTMFGLQRQEIEGEPEAALAAALARRGVRFSEETATLTAATGDEFQRHTRALPDGARLELFRDVSREKVEAQRREEILGVASHDLRSPLANVRSYAGLLLTGRIPGVEPRVRHSAEVIARNADRALRLLQSWFDTWRAETGELDVDRQPYDLKGLLNESLDSRRAAAAEKGVELVAALPLGLPAVEVDHDRFRNALDALLDNALARTLAGGRVELSCEQRIDQVLISVSDTGPALSAEEVERLFDRDEQVLREKHLGLGFSLAVARAVMQAHGGVAGLTTEGGRTTFYLKLPFASARA